MIKFITFSLFFVLGIFTQANPLGEERHWWENSSKRMVDIIMAYNLHESENVPYISKEVQHAMIDCPRHEFVPKHLKDYAYEDTPLQIGENMTISQPQVVALMTELLQLKEGDNVLEIGTGSGYQAAILATLGVNVYTIEIKKGLYDQQITRMEKWKQVHLKYGDGYNGWPEHAPFDAIIITAAAFENIPEPQIEQTKVGGIIVAPVEDSNGHQKLYQSKKTENGLESKFIIPVRFVPFTRGND